MRLQKFNCRTCSVYVKHRNEMIIIGSSMHIHLRSGTSSAHHHSGEPQRQFELISFEAPANQQDVLKLQLSSERRVEKSIKIKITTSTRVAYTLTVHIFCHRFASELGTTCYANFRCTLPARKAPFGGTSSFHYSMILCVTPGRTKEFSSGPLLLHPPDIPRSRSR